MPLSMAITFNVRDLANELNIASINSPNEHFASSYTILRSTQQFIFSWLHPNHQVFRNGAGAHRLAKWNREDSGQEELA